MPIGGGSCRRARDCPSFEFAAVATIATTPAAARPAANSASLVAACFKGRLGQRRRQHATASACGFSGGRCAAAKATAAEGRAPAARAKSARAGATYSPTKVSSVATVAQYAGAPSNRHEADQVSGAARAARQARQGRRLEANRPKISAARQDVVPEVPPASEGALCGRRAAALRGVQEECGAGRNAR